MNKEIKLLEANCCIRCPHFFTRFALIYTSIPLEIDNKKKERKRNNCVIMNYYENYVKIYNPEIW